MEQIKEMGQKIKSVISKCCGSTIGRFVLTFMVMHTVAWLSATMYSTFCLDISFFGFFRNMVNGHGPVCYGLQSVAYHAVGNIYALITTAAISSGLVWLSNKIKPVESSKSSESNESNE